MNYCRYCEQDIESTLTEEEANARIALLSDLIGIHEGNTIEELHPEMSLEEMAAYTMKLYLFQNTL